MSTPSSYDNILKKWAPEIKLHVNQAPIILVGTKSDLRNDEQTLLQLQRRNQVPVTREQGEKLMKEIGAVAYLECSAKRNLGVKDVFNAAIRAALYVNKKEKVTKCSIL